MQIGEKNFLSGKEETRRNPDGFQEFLTQPDEKFSVKIRAGAYWYSFLKIGKVRRSKCGADFVVVLGGRQPACVLRRATPCFPSPPFYRFSTALTIQYKRTRQTPTACLAFMKPHPRGLRSPFTLTPPELPPGDTDGYRGYSTLPVCPSAPRGCRSPGCVRYG